jgi:hypothetical protein
VSGHIKLFHLSNYEQLSKGITPECVMLHRRVYVGTYSAPKFLILICGIEEFTHFNKSQLEGVSSFFTTDHVLIRSAIVVAYVDVKLWFTFNKNISPNNKSWWSRRSCLSVVNLLNLVTEDNCPN